MGCVVPAAIAGGVAGEVSGAAVAPAPGGTQPASVPTGGPRGTLVPVAQPLAPRGSWGEATPPACQPATESGVGRPAGGMAAGGGRLVRPALAPLRPTCPVNLPR